MTHAELRDEVMRRVKALEKSGRRSVTASVVANHGDKLSTAACWRALDDEWADGGLDWVGEDSYRSARPMFVGEWQTALDVP